MAYKTLIFGVDDLYPKLEPFYKQHVELGNLEIVAFAVLEKDKINLIPADGKMPEEWDFIDIDIAVISSKNDFYNRMKILEAQGIPRENIIDGRVFQIPNLDFPLFIKEGIAHGTFKNITVSDLTNVIYPRIYQIENRNLIIKVGRKTYFCGITIDISSLTNVSIDIGNFSSIAWGITYELIHANDHNYGNVGSYGLFRYDWKAPKDFFSPKGTCKINVGNDVWIGRGCILKSTNPDKPLIIGDGAVISSDSVVVKNVPPYAIVGGNPAQIIKFRFPEDVIESLLRIKWWDWSLDKIHDNFKYWNDIEQFISLHDK